MFKILLIISALIYFDGGVGSVNFKNKNITELSKKSIENQNKVKSVKFHSGRKLRAAEAVEYVLKTELEKHCLVENQNIEDLRKDVSKLQSLVQILRDQQYILSLLDDVDIKTVISNKSPEERAEALKHMKIVADTSNTIQYNQRNSEDSGNSIETEIILLKAEIDKLKKIVNISLQSSTADKIEKENFEKHLTSELTLQKYELYNLRQLVNKLAFVLNKSGQKINNTNLIAREANSEPSLDSNSQIKILEKELDHLESMVAQFQHKPNQENISNQTEILKLFPEEVIVKNDTNGDQIVGKSFTLTSGTTKAPSMKNSYFSQSNVVSAFNKSIHSNSSASKYRTNKKDILRKATEDEDDEVTTDKPIKSKHLEELERLEKELSMLTQDNIRSEAHMNMQRDSSSNIKKLLKSLDENDEDSESSDSSELLKQLTHHLSKNKKKKPNTDLKKLLKKIEEENTIESKTIDEDDTKEEIKKLRKLLSKQKKPKVESKNLPEEEDEGLKLLQEAINELKPKNEFDDLNDVEQKTDLNSNTNFQLMLNKLISHQTGNHMLQNKPSNSDRIEELKKQILQLKNGYGFQPTNFQGINSNNQFPSDIYSTSGGIGQKLSYSNGFYQNPYASDGSNYAGYGIPNVGSSVNNYSPFNANKIDYSGPNRNPNGQVYAPYSNGVNYVQPNQPNILGYGQNSFINPNPYSNINSIKPYSNQNLNNLVPKGYIPYGNSNTDQYSKIGNYPNNNIDNSNNPSSFNYNSLNTKPYISGNNGLPLNSYDNMKPISSSLSSSYSTIPGGYSNMVPSNNPRPNYNNDQNTYANFFPANPQIQESNKNPQANYGTAKAIDTSNTQQSYSYTPQTSTTNEAYTQEKVDDLKNQIYNLQNIINNLNRPEYTQKPEDKQTVYKLEDQINNLKNVINNLTQDNKQTANSDSYNTNQANSNSNPNNIYQTPTNNQGSPANYAAPSINNPTPVNVVYAPANPPSTSYQSDTNPPSAEQPAANSAYTAPTKEDAKPSYQAPQARNRFTRSNTEDDLNTNLLTSLFSKDFLEAVDSEENQSNNQNIKLNSNQPQGDHLQSEQLQNKLLDLKKQLGMQVLV